MNTKAESLAAAQGGLLTRAQALDTGLSRNSIDHALRTGALVRVQHGSYALGTVWAAADEFRGRHRLRTRAALLRMHRNWVVSHGSAAHEHGLAILNPPEPFVHITREGWTGAWTKNGVKHHLARFGPNQLVEIEGLRVLDLARTVVDIAREDGRPYGEIACDAALRRGLTRLALESALEPMAYWPHVVRARACVAFGDPGAQSAVETMGRMLVAALGVDDVETQFPVLLPDGREAWGDIRVGCHIFECDGKGKYVPTQDGGLATRRPVEILWDEKRRERALHQVGLGTSRIYAEDYWNPRRDVVVARMRAEYQESLARFGPRLPEHLIRNARELRGRRGA